MRTIRTLAVALVTILSVAPTAAHAYPEKPIRFVVPFSAGGSTDVTARIVGEAMSKYLGQPIIIENRTGGAGSIGGAYVAKATPDGYTMLAGGVGPISVVPALDPNLPYNPQRDLAAVGQITNNDYGLVVAQDSQFKTATDLFEGARARPGQISYMTTGTGGPLHVTMEYLAKGLGITLNHIPYQGESQAVGDLLASRIDVAVMSVTAAAPLIKSGKARMLALMSEKRSEVLPDVPAIKEMGYENYEIPIWIGMFVPAGTPSNVISTLNNALEKALQQPDVRTKLLDLGAEPVGGTSDKYERFLERESERWRTRISETGIQR